MSLDRVKNSVTTDRSSSNSPKPKLTIEPLQEDVKLRILKSLEILASLPIPQEETLDEQGKRIKYIKSQALKALGAIYSEFYPWMKIDRDPHLGFYYMLSSAKLDDPEACYHVGITFMNALNYLAEQELEPEKYNYIKSSSFMYGSEYDKETSTFVYIDEKSRKKKNLIAQGKEELLKQKKTSEEYLKYPGITKDVVYIKLKENEKFSVEYLKKAADLGDVDAQLIMSKIYLEGKAGVSSNLKFSIHYAELAANQHSGQALFNLGSVYLVGMRSQVPKPGFEDFTDYQIHTTPNSTELFEIKKDVAKAIEYYERATLCNSSEAAYFLGHAYHHGLYNLPQNTEKAILYLNQAINSAHNEAAHYLYLMYLTGENCQQDLQKAEYYFKIAIQLQSPNALFVLGDRYFHGKNGYPVDYSKAYEFYTIAGERKNKNALYCLGVMHYHGIHVEKSHRLAYERYTQAASAGSKEAYLALSDMVLKGEGGVPRDEHYAKQLRIAHERLVAIEEGRAINQCKDTDPAMVASAGCGKSTCQCAPPQ
ncbi:TPR repeat protein [Naegleria gruberi]|uniref:TPR repeat protein n=1 Tax=Naegleria gruberi TaxID=5762 RepID=D2UXJ2_NAEGR|nr:TPR repeat protein [Naegleria gruberi]EFC50294.1 TPR repeat protein [Naegleria gruberi]|eukprot:XP_002683038.1 TPR repeat protein [Naegleria gruberi strain NEG-M]